MAAADDTIWRVSSWGYIYHQLGASHSASLQSLPLDSLRLHDGSASKSSMRRCGCLGPVAVLPSSLFFFSHWGLADSLARNALAKNPIADICVCVCERECVYLRVPRSHHLRSGASESVETPKHPDAEGLIGVEASGVGSDEG